MTRTVTCRDGVRLLFDITEGRLDDRRRSAVETHVSGCLRCRRFVASYRATPGIIRSATADPLPAPMGLRLRRILAHLPPSPTSRKR